VKRVPWPLLLAVGSALAVLSTSSRAEDEEIHECRDASGNVVYQHDPCTNIRGGTTAKKDDESRPKAKQAKGAGKSQASVTTKKAPPASPWPVLERRRDPIPPVSYDTAHPGNPRFSSPERTWKTFTTALRDGDRDAAVSCLTSTALRELGSDVESFPLENLRDTVVAFTGIEVEGQAGPFWSIRAQRPRQLPKWIFFERTDAGDWKIAGI